MAATKHMVPDILLRIVHIKLCSTNYKGRIYTENPNIGINPFEPGTVPTKWHPYS